MHMHTLRLSPHGPGNIKFVSLLLWLWTRNNTLSFHPSLLPFPSPMHTWHCSMPISPVPTWNLGMGTSSSGWSTWEECTSWDSSVEVWMCVWGRQSTSNCAFIIVSCRLQQSSASSCLRCSNLQEPQRATPWPPGTHTQHLRDDVCTWARHWHILPLDHLNWISLYSLKWTTRDSKTPQVQWGTQSGRYQWAKNVSCFTCVY